MSTKLIQRIHKTDAKDVVHSSAYGKAQANVNATAYRADSFTQRQKLEHNRQHVQGYNRSRIMQGGNKMPRAAAIEENKPSAEAGMVTSTVAASEAQTPLQQITAAPGASDEWYANHVSSKTLAATQAAKDATTVARGYGRTTSAELRQQRSSGYANLAGQRQRGSNSYASLAEQRQARADRFAGGVKTANGGTVAPRSMPRSVPRPPVNFGRH